MAERDACAVIADALPEVATGAATGADRAAVLRHLAGCARCRQELEELARIADDLLPLVPEREPPAGFEATVLSNLPVESPAAAPPVRTRRRWRRPVLRLAAAAMACALAAALAGGVVWRRTSADRHLAGEYRQTLAIGNGQFLRSARITDGSGAVVGHLYAYQGEPSWVYVTVTDAPVPGRYQLVLTDRDGRLLRVGECVAQGRYCGTGATIDFEVNDITAARLARPDGPTLVAQLG